MPGVVEDTDPGEPRGSSQSDVTVTGPVAPPTPLDLELQGDRLRLMGLDAAFVEEFLRRAATDAADAYQWLAGQLAALTPPEPPPTCDCGEVLVEHDWRGLAVVRCSECGARWRLDVTTDDTWSQSAVEGPSDEWLAAHPVQLEDPYGQFDPEQVIESGLPPLVPRIEPGTCHPVASWTGGPFAAVLYVCRNEPGDFDFPGDEYGHEVEHLLLRDGTWESAGAGVGGWVNALDPPRDLLEKYVVFGTGTSGFTEGSDWIHFTGGICSTAVASVETSDLDGTRRIEVDPSRPFFLTGVRGTGTVKVLGADGAVLRSRTGDPLAWEVGSHWR